MKNGFPSGLSAKAHVLIVDDEPIIHDLLRSFLTAEGFEVSSALGAAEGMQALEVYPVDLLIVDLNLRGTRGDVFCQEAKGVRPGLRLILMTGDWTADLSEIQRQSGADLVLFKPFTMSELLLALNDIQERTITSRDTLD